MPHHLERLIVVPVNGYVNRLQAWASATLLGQDFGVPVSVLWLSQTAAPADARDLFDPVALADSFTEVNPVARRYPDPTVDIPTGLHVDPADQLVTLAGRERGEQYYMPDLTRLLTEDNEIRTLVIVAGGLFHLGSEAQFTDRRCAFYRNIRWHAEIQRLVDQGAEAHRPFIALHSRTTDRSREVATERSLKTALGELASKTGLTSLFISADSPAGRDYWLHVAQRRGLQAWNSSDVAFDRTSKAAGRSALVDWLIMTKAAGVVYSDASTFGREAVVAGGTAHVSIGLAPGAGVRFARVLKEWIDAARTYPQRHWNWGAS